MLPCPSSRRRAATPHEPVAGPSPRAPSSASISSTDSALPAPARASARRQRVARSSASAIAFASATTLPSRCEVDGAGRRDRRGEVPPRARPGGPAGGRHRDREHRRRRRRCTGCTCRPTSTRSRTGSATSFDRERGWGRRDETFRATEELRPFDPDRGVVQSRRPRPGHPPVPDEPARRRADAVGGDGRRRAALRRPRRGSCPMTDDPVTTRIAVVAERRATSTCTSRSTGCGAGRGRGEGRSVRGRRRRATRRPASSRRSRTRTRWCSARRTRSPRSARSSRSRGSARRSARAATDVVGVSAIVAGAPLAGMADRLMPAAGVEVTAAGAAECYRGLLGAWVIDDVDRALDPRIEAHRASASARPTRSWPTTRRRRRSRASRSALG